MSNVNKKSKCECNAFSTLIDIIEHVDSVHNNQHKCNCRRQKIEDELINCLRGQPGFSGVPGVPGVSGASGPSGAPGVSGPSGDPGVSGPSGDPGVSGPSGDPGVSGPSGDPGVSGPSGDPGVSGPSGATGSIGPPGPGNAESNIVALNVQATTSNWTFTTTFYPFIYLKIGSIISLSLSGSGPSGITPVITSGSHTVGESFSIQITTVSPIQGINTPALVGSGILLSPSTGGPPILAKSAAISGGNLQLNFGISSAFTFVGTESYELRLNIMYKGV